MKTGKKKAISEHEADEAWIETFGQERRAKYRREFGLSPTSESLPVEPAVLLSGGGGTSTNGAFSVTGTIGQPDSGAKLAGGNYSVEGGFWSVAVIVQTPGAPLLSLTHLRDSGILFFSWPVTPENYSLESTPLLGPSGAWTPVSASVQEGSQYRSISLPQQSGQRYYRLRQINTAPSSRTNNWLAT